MTITKPTSPPQLPCGRQRSDRRVHRRFVFKERRSGFERRTSCRSRAVNALETPLRRLRDDPALLVETLVFLNLLSVVDLLLTITALRLGATELNPLMARLFEAGTAPTALVKTALVLVATLGLWALRRYRAALTATVALLIVYGLLATFELTGLLLLSL